ncbi:unnamed protein product [Callosobruchus maculatus]|uniref:Uncharacterized protein n=1 Tax=Callosobruchus maculatus TaxID=64391 RepID=A0A653BUT0_CALMS|nr:unnamed protein product [Callosobruchus maculatus]
MIEDKSRITYKIIWSSQGIGMTTIQKILHDHLRVRKVCCLWVPHNFSEAQKQHYVELVPTDYQEILIMVDLSRLYDTRDRRHERHRRHSKDRYKRQRSRSNSRDNKRDRHKRRSERKSCTRDRSLDLKKDSIRGNLAESDNNSYNKTTGRQRKRSQDRKRAEETCKNTNSDSRRLKDNRDPKKLVWSKFATSLAKGK